MNLQAPNIVDCQEITCDMIEDYLAKRYQQQVLKTKFPFDVEIQLILARNCNLNCTNCQAGCNINDKNELMTLNEIKYAIPKLKEFFQDKILQIVLFGGEPLLNPEYEEICYYIRSELPEASIDIYTNGILKQNWTEKDYEFAVKNEVHFTQSLYPLGESYFNNTQKQEELMTKLGIKHEICGNRPFFIKGGYNKTGSSNPNRFFQCCHSMFPPHFYLFKKQLWRCAPTLSWDKINIPCFLEDYLNIDNLTEERFIEYCSKPLKICKYCGNSDELGFGSDEIITWHHQKDLPSNYDQTLYDLYINNYKLYYKYVHDCKTILPCFDNQYFIDNIKAEDLPSHPSIMFLKKFKTGLGDVCIPFDKESCQDIKNLLKFKKLILNQNNYLNINFYFISLDGNKPAKSIIYRMFPPASCDLEGNIYLLESDNPNNFYQIFLQNSYLKKKICILNYKDLLDKNYLLNKFNEMDG